MDFCAKRSVEVQSRKNKVAGIWYFFIIIIGVKGDNDPSTNTVPEIYYLETAF